MTQQKIRFIRARHMVSLSFPGIKTPVSSDHFFLAKMPHLPYGEPHGVPDMFTGGGVISDSPDAREPIVFTDKLRGRKYVSSL